MTDAQTEAREIADKIAEIRRQLAINVDIAKRDHPEGPMVDGKRLSAVCHSQEILASHVTDRLTELEAIITTALAAKDAELAELRKARAAPAVAYWRGKCQRAEAQFAEARKALGRIANVLPGDTATDTLTTATNRLNAVLEIARREHAGGEDAIR